MDQDISQPRVLGLGETAPPSLAPGFRLLITGQDSEGALALIETCERRGSGPPLHRHTRETELIIVLEGQVTFHIAGEHFHGTPGTCAVLQRGTDHGYVVESDGARLLTVLIPAGLEGGLSQLRHILYGAKDQQVSAMSQNGERIVSTFARYGVEVTAPEANVHMDAITTTSVGSQSPLTGPQ